MDGVDTHHSTIKPFILLPIISFHLGKSLSTDMTADKQITPRQAHFLLGAIWGKGGGIGMLQRENIYLLGGLLFCS